jgi:cytochrome c-type biogenesis protein CcmH/NrfG
MLHHYTVGMKIQNQSGHVTVEAEDALIAALKVKHEHPQAMITYARKTNERGDQRHPDRDLPLGRE